MRHKIRHTWITGLVLLLVVFASLETMAQQPPDNVFSIDWSPDGETIAIAYSGGTVQVQSALTGELLYTLQSDTSGPTTAVAFHPDPAVHKLATAGADGIVHLWDSTNGELLASLTNSFSIIWSLEWHPTESDILASGFFGGEIDVWDTTTEHLLFSRTYSDFVYDIDWNADGSRLVSSGGSSIALWDGENGDFIARIPTSSGLLGEMISVDWGSVPNENLVVAASNIGFLVKFNMSAQAESGVITGPFTQTLDGLTAVSLSPDSTRIATTGSDGKVRIWNVAMGEVENIFDAGIRVNDVAWSPDGESIVYGGDEGVVKIVPVEMDTDAG